jgi:uncharacterized protein YpiB (UPF0302 family)
MSEEFIDAVKSWVKSDDLIREITLALREKKQERKKLEERVLEFMKRADQDVLSISTGGSLRRTVTKTKAGLKQDYLREVMGKFTSNPDEAVRVILEGRPVSEREYLKRTHPRASKK